MCHHCVNLLFDALSEDEVGEGVHHWRKIYMQQIHFKFESALQPNERVMMPPRKLECLVQEKDPLLEPGPDLQILGPPATCL